MRIQSESPQRNYIVTSEKSVTYDEQMAAIASPLFTNWLEALDPTWTIDRIHLQSIDLFGHRVGFIKLKAQIVDQNGVSVPGIVLLRGKSVAILMIVHHNGQDFAVLTAQARVATGKVILELPAGMADDEHDLTSVAMREVAEETGLILEPKRCSDLTAIIGISEGIYSSPGACDEAIHYFVAEQEVGTEAFANLQGKQTGLIEDGEAITLELVPLERLINATQDGKVFIALALYRAWQTRQH